MKKTVMMLVLALTAASLAGCGSKSADTPANDSNNTTEVAAATESTGKTAESDTLKDGVLTVGTNAEFPPFEYVGDDGNPDGFDMALMNAIGEKLGVKVEFENMEFDSLVAAIGSKIDVAASGMTITDERKKMVNFSDPYYEAVQYVIVAKDSKIATADDLKSKNIGVQLGTTGDILAGDIEGANVSTYNKAIDAVNDLINGRLDCVIIDKNPAEVFQSKYSDKVTSIDGAKFGFETEDYGIAMPKDDQALTDAVNSALKELKADGTFDKLVSKYITETE